MDKGNHTVVRTLTFQGMRVAVETDKGHVRHWHNTATGERGETKMRYPYGYFIGTKKSGDSGDGMALDVYVGPEEEAENVYVVHQMKTPSFTEEDELKVMVGFESLKQARAAYLMHYSDERFFGHADEMTVDEFKTKYITPYANKALESAPSAQPDQPVPQRMPGLPGMGPAGFMPMMQMGPPPLDVETFDGVNAALGRIGSMKDPELLNVAEEIWGPGYQFIEATPDHVRAEVLGFLLDQRDLLELIKPPTPPPSAGLPGQMSSPSSPLSPNGQQPPGGPSLAAISQAVASVVKPLMGSSQQAPSSQNNADPSQRTESTT